MIDINAQDTGLIKINQASNIPRNQKMWFFKGSLLSDSARYIINEAKNNASLNMLKLYRMKKGFKHTNSISINPANVEPVNEAKRQDKNAAQKVSKINCNSTM